jgi:hypothetical protein
MIRICIFFLFSSLVIHAQTSLKWELIDKMPPNIQVLNVEEGNALLIFDSSLDLTFDSSVEALIPPTFKNGKYYLYLTPGKQAITFTFDGDDNTINFGTVNKDNSLPALMPGEIKLIKITKLNELLNYDITDKEISKGNSITPIGVNVSDALIVFKVIPNDLVVDIIDQENTITKQTKEPGKYSVYFKTPGSHNIKIKCDGFEITSLPELELKSKELKFYLIKRPTSELQTKPQPETKVDKYKNVLGFWGGTLGTNEVYLAINEVKEGIVSGKIFFNGIYQQVSGFISQKSNNEYFISIKKPALEDISESATLDFNIKNGIASGDWISKSRNILDFNALQVNTIPIDNTDVLVLKYKELQTSLKGDWTSIQNSLFSMLVITNIDFKRKITGFAISKNNEKIPFSGIAYDGSSLNIMINFPSKSSIAGTLSLSSSNDKLIGNYTSNDGEISLTQNFAKGYVQNLTTVKPSLTEYKISGVFEALKDRVYFYSSPDINNKTSSYIVKLQKINISKSFGSFYYGTFTNDKITTSGYLLKSDLIRSTSKTVAPIASPKVHSITDIIGKWECVSARGKIFFDIQNIYDGGKLDGQIVYSRETIPLEGTVKISKEGVFYLLIKENPEVMDEYVEHTQEFDDENGVYTINIKNNVGSGTWKSLSGKRSNIIKSFKLIKK